MKVKELVAQLLELPQEDEIVLTSMDDFFFESEFEVHSAYEDGQAQEIIIPCYFERYLVESTQNLVDHTGLYTEGMHTGINKDL